MAAEAGLTAEREERLGLFQLLVLALSVFVLAGLAAEAFLPLRPELRLLLIRLDAPICAVFIADFLGRLWKAEDKARFLAWGWVDLVSSIPALPVLRWGRVLRVYRLLRVLRAFRSVKLLMGHLYRRRARAACATAFFAAGLAALFSSVAVLIFEDAPGASIRTASDALWWSLYTMANMDYLNLQPVSAEGKLIRFLLVTAGMVLFAVVTGYAASLFMSSDGESARLRELRREVEELRTRLGREKTPL